MFIHFNALSSLDWRKKLNLWPLHLRDIQLSPSTPHLCPDNFTTCFTSGDTDRIILEEINIYFREHNVFLKPEQGTKESSLFLPSKAFLYSFCPCLLWQVFRQVLGHRAAEGTLRHRSLTRQPCCGRRGQWYPGQAVVPCGRRHLSCILRSAGWGRQRAWIASRQKEPCTETWKMKRQGDKVPGPFQRFWREGPEGGDSCSELACSTHVTGLEVSSPLPRETHFQKPHTPLTHMLLFLKCSGLFDSPLMYIMRAGPWKWQENSCPSSSSKKGVLVLSGRLTQTYFDEELLYLIYLRFLAWIIL